MTKKLSFIFHWVQKRRDFFWMQLHVNSNISERSVQSHLVWMGHFLQAGRTRRSHPEEEGRVTKEGGVRRSSPAVAASERRKSLKLVRRSEKYRRPFRSSYHCSCSLRFLWKSAQLSFIFLRIVCWGRRAVSCFSVPCTASPVRLSSRSTPGCGTAAS